MNILYYSVHHILEYDEVVLFRSLGHDVFRLGTRDRTTSTASWRSELPNSAREEQLHDIYEAMGGKYHFESKPEDLLPHDFIEHFSLVIVMHSVEFISEHWSKLAKRPVIWRTIGQNIEGLESRIRPFREQGLRIIRYSPRELRCPGTVGGDAVIRFSKDPEMHNGWTGTQKHILTFSNTYEQRYPVDAQIFRAIAERLPCILGGAGNEAFAESIGMVSAEEQACLYKNARVYLYASALQIPYTLNFIEAWMTGVPVIVYAPLDRIGKYYEVDEIVRDGETGFVCRTLEEVISRALELLSDAELAGRISVKGRSSAIAFFAQRRIAAQWAAVLAACAQ